MQSNEIKINNLNEINSLTYKQKPKNAKDALNRALTGLAIALEGPYACLAISYLSDKLFITTNRPMLSDFVSKTLENVTISKSEDDKKNLEEKERRKGILAILDSIKNNQNWNNQATQQNIRNELNNLHKMLHDNFYKEKKAFEAKSEIFPLYKSFIFCYIYHIFLND